MGQPVAEAEMQGEAVAQLDVRGDDGFDPVEALDLDLERLDVLDEERRLSVGAVVDEQIASMLDMVIEYARTRTGPNGSVTRSGTVSRD